jgi:hypothetical protein
MSLIQSMMAKETIVEVEYPDIEGFVLQLQYLGRDDLTKIRNQCLSYKFSKQTRQREEVVDNDKFIEVYAQKAIKGWTGLKIKDLPKLLPVDISDKVGSKDIPYTEEEALDLIRNSTVFDQFITDAMNDYEQFSISKRDTDAKNSQST